MHLIICAIAIVALLSIPVHAAVGDTTHLFGKLNAGSVSCGDGTAYSTTGLCLNQPYDMWLVA